MARAEAEPLPASVPAEIPARRRLRRLLWLAPLLLGIAGASVAAAIATIPEWGRWTLAGTALAGISVLAIAVLVGPAARRLAGERHPLTPTERQQMTATERVEAVNAARHTLIQAATGLVVIGGVVFTAQGLWYTAQSLDASRQAQRTAEQGLITDRYTKAVEQLGSTTLDVRLGGLYALERLAQDSPRDHGTVYDVLTAFVREHDPKPSVKAKDLPDKPATDVQAALTVISRRDGTRAVRRPNLAEIRTPGAALRGANLRDATLNLADLTGADLTGAALHHATLIEATLIDAVLTDAVLTDAVLTGADLHHAGLSASDLTRADLSSVDLRGADLNLADLIGTNLTLANLTGTNLTRAKFTEATLRVTNLSGADLRGADLIGANLSGANLTEADLRGAYLGEVVGVTEDEIRKVALVDETTFFV
ncbi:pentapeptide repeat-containing protein [Nonomuraea sp. PA05]|uniref:pentapeptide repeat-containing protein n=1 Tax=Nonomuraea sp. PA05 TaxID=2604466 RepID=UPI001652B630|nr:pentapeptide repeat-containing protein [Nonomuraea sp. PA05]